MFKLTVAIALLAALVSADDVVVTKADDKDSLRENSIRFDDDSDSNSVKTRFLGPETLETIGRLFLTQSQLSSCYSCSTSFPEQARSCCHQGFITCCHDDVYGSSYGKGIYAYSTGYTGYGSRIKPGECPYASPYSQSHCSRQCVTDADCTADYKCCSYGCSTYCASPARSTVTVLSSTRYEKPGVCPFDYFSSFDDFRTSYGGYGYSSYQDRYYGNWIYGSRDSYNDCYNDSDCPGSQKCCRRRNRRSCISVNYSYSYGRR